MECLSIILYWKEYGTGEKWVEERWDIIYSSKARGDGYG